VNLDEDNVWGCSLHRGGSAGPVVGIATGMTDEVGLTPSTSETSDTILALTHLDGTEKLTLTCLAAATAGTTINDIRMVAVRVGSISFSVQH
jgi:hypothetical protein